MDAAVTIAQYKEQLKAQGYADNTMELHRSGLERFRDYLEGRTIADLRTVTKQTMLGYQAHIMAGTQAAETKALLIRPVKRLFEHLTKNNLLLINPAEGLVEISRKQKKIGPTLSRCALSRCNMLFQGCTKS